MSSEVIPDFNSLPPEPHNILFHPCRAPFLYRVRVAAGDLEE